MRIETVASAQCRPAGTLAQLVGSVASDQFGPSLLAFMRDRWGIAIVAVYGFRPPSGETRLLLGAGDMAPERVSANAGHYAGQYAAHDPARRAVTASAYRAGAIATCLSLHELPEPGHRDLLEHAGVLDRYACFFPGPGEWTSLHAMRTSEYGPISRREFGQMRDFSATLGALLALHFDQSRDAIAPSQQLRLRLQRAAPTLSLRECDVCALLLSGRSSPEIAAALGIGVGSVHTYRKRAYLKLGVGDMREIFMRLMGLH